MSTEYVLWGTEKGEPDWAESVIYTTQSKDDPKLAQARRWAEGKGMRNIRLATIRPDGDGSDLANDFRKTAK